MSSMKLLKRWWANKVLVIGAFSITSLSILYLIAFNYLSILIPIDVPDQSKMFHDEEEDYKEEEKKGEEDTDLLTSHEEL